MAEREQILADFQACTGIENLEECIVILEQHDWNLMAAVKNAIEPSLMGPSHSDEHLPVQSTDTYHPSFDDLLSSQRVAMYTDSGGGGSSSGIPEAAMPVASHIPSTSQVFGGAQARFLNFSVEYRDRTIPLVVKDTERVVRIKELLQSTLDLPVSKMQLSGWVNKYDNGVADDDLLRMLHLPKENTLFLLTPDVNQPTVNLAHNGDLNPEDIERLSKMFTLNIRDKDKDKLYQLHYPGSLTIQEVKADVFAVTDVPVRHQLWTGWPEAARDETMTLAGSGVTFPSHNFEVCHRPVTPVEPRQEEDMDAEYNMLTVDAEASDEDFEDAHESFGVEEDMFESDAASTQTHKQQPLMPPDCDDQTKALEHFVREFSTRYGDCHPIFYIGRLEDAITDALQCRARERKLLAVYLHHDDSILANVFCSQILCSETVVDYLSSNFITWAWDLTSEANKARLLTLCTRYFGSIAANTVRNFKADELPLLLIFSRSRRTNEVVDVVHGNTTLDELMTHLIRAVDLFNQQQIAEIAEEDERNARESVKREQDDAYQLSLAADRAKAEAKRRGEEERRKQVEDEARKNELIEEKRREAEAEKEAIRQSIQDQLPPEPSENCKQPLSNIRLRCPGGEMFTRRFLASTRLQVLLNFVTVKGFDTANYKVLTTFPRRDLTQLDSQETLEKLKLYPQETLILEEK